MAEPRPVDPVKLIVAVLWSDEAALDRALQALQVEWGDIDFGGPQRDFDVTDYYQQEMGSSLRRQLLAFAGLIPPESIAKAKLICNRIEQQSRSEHGRRVNLDIGYLDHNKIVLASVKFAGQKIHLGDGVYADLIARYGDGRYQPFEWTFPDFRDGRYDDELAAIRRIYLSQLHESR